MTSSLRPAALGGLALGSVLALVAGSRPWWRADGTGVSVAFTGTETTAGLAQALALVALAGALLALVLRVRGRRVLGVLILLAGAGAVVVGLTRPRPASGTVRSRVLEVSLADQFALVGTAWPYVYAVAGLVVAAAAVTMVLTAARWPSRAARFERPGVDGAGATAAAVAPGPASDDPAALWRLMDAGVDPTAGTDPAADDGDEHGREDGHTVQPGADDTTNHAPSADPSGGADVHEQLSGDTMRARAAARHDEPT